MFISANYIWENVILNKGASELHQGGVYDVATSDYNFDGALSCRNGSNTWRYHCSSRPTPHLSPTHNGVKVPKDPRGYIYQPPSLKVCSYLALDRFRSQAGLPRSRLYEGVQKFMDSLIDQVGGSFNGPGSYRYSLTE